MKSSLFHALLAVVLAIATLSCGSSSSDSKDDMGGDDPLSLSPSRLKVSLVDAPGEYDEVNLDIKEVNIRFQPTADDEEGRGEWIDVTDFTPEIVDILTLVNGKEMTLVDRPVFVGTINDIRLILGHENSVVVGGQSYELKVPSGEQSGIKIQLEQVIAPESNYKLILDFDACKSIVTAGKSGKYLLKPVIRARLEKQSGAISGTVLPAQSGVIAYAISESDSISTFTDDSGAFLIRGLIPDTYTVSVSNDARTIRRLNVEVFAGFTSNAGVFDFQ